MNQPNAKQYKYLLWFLCLFVGVSLQAQQKYRSFKIGARGDTINAILQDGNKEGKWVIRVEEVRGEPGYEEEGEFRKGQKDGYWRRYSLMGDLVAVEHYMLGG